MKFFAIGDVHLSFRRTVDPSRWEDVETSKPMDLFGDEWRHHYRKLYENWLGTVDLGDVVLMPGDFSWAMNLNEACYDLAYLGLLPGTIAGVAGNHDYWWQSLSRVRAVLPANMRVIQNDHLVFGKTAVCGSRGWTCPGGDYYQEKDYKIYRRELIRMENSLKSASSSVEDKIVIIHFMPTNDRHEKNELIELFQEYGVSTVVYGHLHGAATGHRLPHCAWGINFHLVSADYVGFSPILIRES